MHSPSHYSQRVSCRPVGFFLLAIMLSSFSLIGNAAEAQNYRITLLTPADKELVIGKLVITAMAAVNGFKVELDDAAFSDHFLSMRPFKCLAADKNMQCHQPYPYPNRRYISSKDLIDLEYHLLFIQRSPKEYGIDAWNGRYYQLHWDDNDIVGEIKEVDLNMLVAPPKEGNLRPISADDLNETDLQKQWLPRIRIELVE